MALQTTVMLVAYLILTCLPKTPVMSSVTERGDPRLYQLGCAI